MLILLILLMFHHADGTPPVITGCPESFKVSTEPDLSTAQANWIEPSATDNGPLVSLTSDLRIGDVFQLGATEVTYTATDDVDLTSTCRFNVTVEGEHHCFETIWMGSLYYIMYCIIDCSQ